VKVKASCGDEACTVTGSGNLRNVKEPGHRGDVGQAGLNSAEADLAPGETTTLKLKLDNRDETAPANKTRKKARKAVDNGKKVKAKVKVRATDVGLDYPRGDREHVATAKRTITLVK
jgi:hypothetical protein